MNDFQKKVLTVVCEKYPFLLKNQCVDFSLKNFLEKVERSTGRLYTEALLNTPYDLKIIPEFENRIVSTGLVYAEKLWSVAFIAQNPDETFFQGLIGMDADNADEIVLIGKLYTFDIKQMYHFIKFFEGFEYKKRGSTVGFGAVANKDK